MSTAASRRKQEVGVVEHVEDLPPKFEMGTLGKSDGLKQRHISVESVGASESIASQICHASQAWSGKESPASHELGAPAIRPHAVRRINELRERVGTVVLATVQVVIAAQILAISGGYVGH